MADPHVISALNRKFAELAGALKQAEGRSRWAGKGRASQAALVVLRAADQPLSAREIAVRIMKAKGIDATDARAVKEVASGVHGALKRRIGSGVVAHEGYPMLWSVNR